MKRLFLLTTTLLCLCLQVYAYDFNIDGNYYKITSDNTVEVTNNGQNINPIPSSSGEIPLLITFNGITYTVTSIGNEAFYGCSDLTSVTIPESVTSIGNAAFSGCSGLTSVTIPEGVTNIGFNAFAYCSGLQQIIVSNNNPMYDSRDGCNAIIETNTNTLIVGCKNTLIPDGVTSIGQCAFLGRSGLTSVTIPESVTNIGSSAFSFCSDLTSVTIPEGVTSIERQTFKNCSSLTSVTIPEGVTSIGSRTFYGCSSLSSVIIPESVTYIESQTFYGCSSLSSVIIPESVTYIGYEAFYSCSILTSVTIPEGVTNIREEAFYNCNSLTSITIPESVTSIGDNAFYGCNGLTSVEFHCKTIGSWFSGRTSITQVLLGDEVTNIGNNAFYYCSGLTSVVAEMDTPFAIETNVFENISNSCVLTVPYGTRDAYIAAGWTENVFKGGIIEAPAPNIDFADANVKALCVANWDTNGDGELSEAEAAAVSDLGEVFQGNTTIQSFDELQYFTGLTSIGNYAFFDCPGLTSVTIPSSVTSIGESAFRYCSGLTSVTIPNSVTSIGGSAFKGCSGLTSIQVESGNTVYDSRDNCNAIIETATNTLISGCMNTVIPNSVTSIGNNAFNECSGLTSVTIPNSVTSIGNYAFWFCSGLTSLTIPSSVTSIGGSAFKGCSGLTSVKVASGNPVYDSRDNCNAIIKTATNTLISGCKSTVIPNSVTNIGDGAFYHCSGLTSVAIPNSVTSIGNNAFNECSGLTSVTIPNSVTSIGNYAFWDCPGLTSVTIPNSVTSIGNSAFRDCSGLTSVTIPNSVTSIGSYAFNECSGLTSVTIPNSVTSIGGFAFSFCFGLTSVVAEMETPFAFGSSAFYSIGSSCVLTVPYGTRDAYIAAGWTEDVFKGGVVEAPAPVVLATSVTISEETLTLTTAGETATLTAEVLPENVTDGSVTWSSSDESVATVSSDGVVTAVANGTATITATTNDGSNLSATCTVTVNIGDLNNDGTVDVADVMSVINIILELAEETCAADVNGDGSVDIGDIMAIVNIIIKQNSEATPAKRRVRSATTSDDVVVLRKNSGRYAVSLDNEQIYTAFQMTVSVPDGRELKSVEFCDSRLGQFTKVIRPLSDGRYLIMGFSMSGNAISGTVGEIFSIDCESECDITLQNVVFSTPEARSYMLEVAYETGEATAIRANQTMDIHIVGNTVYVDCDKEQQLSVFNLGGSIVKQVRLSQGENAFTLPDGQYIIRNKKISILSK